MLSDRVGAVMKLFTIRRGPLLLSTVVSSAAVAQVPPLTPVPPVADIVVTDARLEDVREIAVKRQISVISDSINSDAIRRRNVSLDVIPSSLSSRVEVHKSVTAAMDGNAIGGIANLRKSTILNR